MQKTLGLLLALAAPLGVAQENTIYGIEFGTPVPWRECSFMAGSPTFRVYDPTPKVTCLQNLFNSGKGLDLSQRTIVHFVFSQRPIHASSDKAELIVVDNTVAALIIDTEGASTQEKIFSDLTAKLGKPRTITRVPVQTMVGAKLDSIRASWANQPLRVDFFGTSGRVDFGYIIVGTAAGFTEIEAREARKAARSGKPP